MADVKAMRARLDYHRSIDATTIDGIWLDEYSALHSEVSALQARVGAAILRLIKLECACPYSDSEAHGVQLMGPLCDRCAAIRLLSGGELPVAKEQPR